MFNGLGEGCKHDIVEAECQLVESSGFDAHEGRGTKVVGQWWEFVGH